MKRRFRTFFYFITVIASTYLVLMIPGPEPEIPATNPERAFAWNQDTRWQELESRFQLARSIGCEIITPRLDSSLQFGLGLLDSLKKNYYGPSVGIFDHLESTTFETAVLAGACPERITSFVNYISQLRQQVKLQSINWDINSPAVRQRIYRLLYGARGAIEEVMLQAQDSLYATMFGGTDEPSATPAAAVLGVTIHSGDILISRGGVATSALIARGNDYAGNFSHCALVYVDSSAHQISMLESHIEKGVSISSLDDYLKDKKFRIMILRLRSDLPELQTDPMLPHRVAQKELDDARSGHIAYDFAMDLSEHEKQFCSEVVSAPYDEFGIDLWEGESSISLKGTVAWLAMFGVRHFETQAPSDLEYDSKVVVVAEWRNPETLYKDHIFNAVTDIMLEEADSGKSLEYPLYQLPIARAMKLYSLILNQFGGIGPIPEGMDARAALRNKYYTQRHTEIVERTYQLAEEFKQTKGYTPPYWELVKLARMAKNN